MVRRHSLLSLSEALCKLVIEEKSKSQTCWEGKQLTHGCRSRNEIKSWKSVFMASLLNAFNTSIYLLTQFLYSLRWEENLLKVGPIIRMFSNGPHFGFLHPVTVITDPGVWCFWPPRDPQSSAHIATPHIHSKIPAPPNSKTILRNSDFQKG